MRENSGQHENVKTVVQNSCSKQLNSWRQAFPKGGGVKRKPIKLFENLSELHKINPVRY